MPYTEHPALTQPDDENAYIWRFIDLPKFLELLHSRSLYFSRGDQFADPYEGMLPDEYVEAIKAGRTNLPGGVHQQVRQFAYYRCTFFLNCWHLSPYESAAMWKLYAGVDAGIALKSTYSRLKHAFASFPDDLHLGLAKYSTDHLWGTLNTLNILMHKRRAFEHEKEVRAVITKPNMFTGRPVDFDSEERITLPLPTLPGPVGIRVPVDVNMLLVGVILSPTSPAWLLESLADTMKRFGCSVPVRQSTLNQLSYLS